MPTAADPFDDQADSDVDAVTKCRPQDQEAGRGHEIAGHLVGGGNLLAELAPNDLGEDHHPDHGQADCTEGLCPTVELVERFSHFGRSLL
jgi:hypothetical protein